MKAVVVERPGELAFRDLPVPKIGEYQALVRVELAAICNSTDTKIISGHLTGLTAYPTTLGHEGIGTVVEVGKKVRAFKVGDRVLNPRTPFTGDEALASSWGTFAEYALASDYEAMVADGVCDAAHGFDPSAAIQRLVPEDIPSRQAILLCIWTEAYSGFSAYRFKPGDSVLVFGGGPLGLSVVKLARLYGMGPVCLAEPVEWKREKALSLGADAVFPVDDDLVAKAREVCPDGFANVVDAVGSPAVINQALRLVRFDGTIGVYGTIPYEQVTLDIAAAPYNWLLVIHQWPDYVAVGEAQEPLMDFIRAGQLSSEDFITHELPLDEIEEGFELVRQGSELKVILSVSQDGDES